jgi:hypothetical protein
MLISKSTRDLSRHCLGFDRNDLELSFEDAQFPRIYSCPAEISPRGELSKRFCIARDYQSQVVRISTPSSIDFLLAASLRHVMNVPSGGDPSVIAHLFDHIPILCGLYLAGTTN